DSTGLGNFLADSTDRSWSWIRELDPFSSELASSKMTPPRETSTIRTRAKARVRRLPDYLQRKLTLPGFRHRRVRQIPTAARQPGLSEYLGTFSALKGQGRPKVGVIQDVEKLRPELHLEALRNLRHREVLV